jgi:hypothetical protein
VPTPDPTPAPTPTPPVAITYPTGVFINEILPNPAGADETEEWLELKNSNNFDVDLSGWQIQDKAGSIKTYTILKWNFYSLCDKCFAKFDKVKMQGRLAE